MQKKKGMKYVGDSRIPAENRKPNVPKDYTEYPGKTEPFWPNFLLKEWLVGAVFLIGFLILTVSAEPPLEKMALSDLILRIYRCRTGTFCFVSIVKIFVRF